MKRIPGYSKYSATKDGRVWSHRERSGWLTPTIDRNGYVRYYVEGDNGKRKGMYIHQIVAQTYIPNPENKPNVNHKDFDKANNSIDNLEWCTQLENIQHDWAHGKRRIRQGEEAVHKVTGEAVLKIRELYQLGWKQTRLAQEFGISQPTISQIVLRKSWRNL